MRNESIYVSITKVRVVSVDGIRSEHTINVVPLRMGFDHRDDVSVPIVVVVLGGDRIFDLFLVLVSPAP